MTTQVTRKTMEGMVAWLWWHGCGGTCLWWALAGSVWPESEVRLSVLCWCVWQESGFIRLEDVFTFNLLYNKIL
jgi:hypothetical protein